MHYNYVAYIYTLAKTTKCLKKQFLVHLIKFFLIMAFKEFVI